MPTTYRRRAAQRFRRPGLVLTATALCAVTLGACGAPEDDAAAAAKIDCSPFESYGDLSGETVSVYTSIVAPEDEPYIESFRPFEECTGITVQYEGSREFDAQLPVRIESGSAPDVVILAQPGLLQRLVRDEDAAVPADEATSRLVEENWSPDWRQYGSVDETLYGVPIGAAMKSFVWYSPGAFEEAGYEVPSTFEDMVALTEQIASDGKVPWCAGIASGDATGWPATDWLEEVVLHKFGPDVYDQWVAHEIPFNDPRILEALEIVGSILKDPDHVNGGLGDVRSIAATEYTGAGLPILDGNCFMHHQASFYQVNWGEGVEVAQDGDVFVFPWPVMDTSVGKAAVGAGDFSVALADRPEVHALQTYLASAEWANVKAEVSGPGWVTANTGLDPANLSSEIDQLAAEQLQSKDLTFRFDASDLMPAEVGAGAEWRELTDWIASDKDDEAVLDAIEAAWP